MSHRLSVYDVARMLEEQIPVGMAKRVSGDIMRDITRNPLTGETGLSRLMSNLIGSGFGAWRVTYHIASGDYTFEHREPNGVRVSWDWDRRPQGWDDSGWFQTDYSPATKSQPL